MGMFTTKMLETKIKRKRIRLVNTAGHSKTVPGVDAVRMIKTLCEVLGLDYNDTLDQLAGGLLVTFNAVTFEDASIERTNAVPMDHTVYPQRDP